MPLDVSLETSVKIADIAQLWREVAERAHPSFFLSWPWVGCWLSETGLEPNLLVARRDGAVIGLALLHRPASRHFWDLPSLHLTSAGGGAFDSLFIEYNGFLAANSDMAAVGASFVRFLTHKGQRHANGGWARLTLPGVDEPMRALLAESGLSLRNEACRASPLIDLAAIRRTGSNYLETRSSNCRQQIRRSIRLFEAAGSLHLAPAENLDEAMAILDELKELHQASWQDKGQDGAFASPFFERFHRRLVREAWPSGQIDLLRLCAGHRTIGCLYNFLHEGRAYAYQSGFDFTRDNRHKPGLVSHALAAQRYLDAGLDRYLLLAGDSRYKRSLATGSDTLHWLVAHRPGLPAITSDLAAIFRRAAELLPRTKARHQRHDTLLSRN